MPQDKSANFPESFSIRSLLPTVWNWPLIDTEIVSFGEEASKTSVNKGSLLNIASKNLTEWFSYRVIKYEHDDSCSELTVVYVIKLSFVTEK